MNYFLFDSLVWCHHIFYYHSYLLSSTVIMLFFTLNLFSCYWWRFLSMKSSHLLFSLSWVLVKLNPVWWTLGCGWIAYVYCMGYRQGELVDFRGLAASLILWPKLLLWLQYLWLTKVYFLFVFSFMKVRLDD